MKTYTYFPISLKFPWVWFCGRVNKQRSFVVLNLAFVRIFLKSLFIMCVSITDGWMDQWILLSYHPWRSIWCMEPNFETFSHSKCVDLTDSQCSRILLMNIPIENPHSDCERNVCRDWIGLDWIGLDWWSPEGGVRVWQAPVDREVWSASVGQQLQKRRPDKERKAR